MIWRSLFLLLATTVATPASAANSLTAAEAFPFSDEVSHSRGFVSSFSSEAYRQTVLAALLRPDRDEVLSDIVPWKMIAGERWFDLRGIIIKKGDLSDHPNLSRLCLDYSTFDEVDLSNLELSGSLFRGAVFSNSRLQRTDFGSADLSCTVFTNCDLTGANFRLASFGEHGKLLLSDLTNARFDHVVGLEQVYYGGGDAVSFHNATLRNIVFDGTRLTEPDFSQADLADAVFQGATLTSPDFTEADLKRIRFSNSRILGAPLLRRATFEAPYFGDVDVRLFDVSYVKWVGGEHLGEELAADMAMRNGSPPKLVARLYSQAERSYRLLSQQYREQGYVAEYRRLRYRSREARRKLLSLGRTSEEKKELPWLILSNMWDRHGTSVTHLLRNYLLTVLIFAATFFFGATILRQRWFVWSKTPPASEGAADPPLDERSIPILPQDLFATRRFSTLAVLKLFVRVFLFSLESSLIFAKRVVDVRELGDYFRRTPWRLEAVGPARTLVGLEVIAGIFFFSSLMRHLLDFLSS